MLTSPGAPLYDRIGCFCPAVATMCEVLTQIAQSTTYVFRGGFVTEPQFHWQYEYTSDNVSRKNKRWTTCRKMSRVMLRRIHRAEVGTAQPHHSAKVPKFFMCGRVLPWLPSMVNSQPTDTNMRPSSPSRIQRNTGATRFEIVRADQSIFTPRLSSTVNRRHVKK